MRTFEKNVSGIMVQMGTNADIMGDIINIIISNKKAFKLVFPFIDKVNFRIANLFGAFGNYDMDKNTVTIAPVARKRIDIISTIAHELVHAEQCFTGKLVKVSGGMQWQGKFYANDTPYNARPWEIEAKKRQGKIAALIAALW